MLKKLLKYDLMSVWRIWWIQALTVLGLSVLGAISLRIIISETLGDTMFGIFYVFAGLFIILSFIGIAGSMIANSLLIYVRFYKHFFTDEGYLTFTLPVSRKKLLLSKSLNALIWTACEVILITISVGIFLLISPPMEQGGFLINTIIYKELFSALAMAWQNIGAWLIVYVIEVLIILLCYYILSMSIVYCCITIGAIIAKKNKLFAAIGIYYLTNAVISFVAQLLLFLGIAALSGGLIIILENASPFANHCVAAMLLLIGCAAMALFAALAYFITLDMLERKLNLS